jgi:hypothetical protein
MRSPVPTPPTTAGRQRGDRNMRRKKMGGGLTKPILGGKGNQNAANQREKADGTLGTCPRHKL